MIEARDGMARMARVGKFNRASLYKTLSANGHPGFENILQLLLITGIHRKVFRRRGAVKNPRNNNNAPKQQMPGACCFYAERETRDAAALPVLKVKRNGFWTIKGKKDGELVEHA